MAARASPLWFTGLRAPASRRCRSRSPSGSKALGHRVEILDGDVVRTQPVQGARLLQRGSRHQRPPHRLRRQPAVAQRRRRDHRRHLALPRGARRGAQADHRRRRAASSRSTCTARSRCSPSATSKGSTRRRSPARSSSFTGVSDPYEAPLSPDVVGRLLEGFDRRRRRASPRQAARARLRRPMRRASHASRGGAAALDGKSPEAVLEWALRHLPAHRHLDGVRARRLRAGGHGGAGETRYQEYSPSIPISFSRNRSSCASRFGAEVRREDRGAARRGLDRRAEPAARAQPVAARHRPVLRAAQGRADGAGARGARRVGGRVAPRSVEDARRRSTSSSTTSGREGRCTR